MRQTFIGGSARTGRGAPKPIPRKFTVLDHRGIPCVVRLSDTSVAVDGVTIDAAGASEAHRLEAAMAHICTRPDPPDDGLPF